MIPVSAYVGSSYLFYFVYLFVVDGSATMTEHHFVVYYCFTSGPFYLTVMLTVGVCLIMDIIIFSIGRFVFTDTRDVVRNHALAKGKVDDTKFLEAWRAKCEQQRILGMIEDYYHEQQVDLVRQARVKHAKH